MKPSCLSQVWSHVVIPIMLCMLCIYIYIYGPDKVQMNSPFLGSIIQFLPDWSSCGSTWAHGADDGKGCEFKTQVMHTDGPVLCKLEPCLQVLVIIWSRQFCWWIPMYFSFIFIPLLLSSSSSSSTRCLLLTHCCAAAIISVLDCQLDNTKHLETLLWTRWAFDVHFWLFSSILHTTWLIRSNRPSSRAASIFLTPEWRDRVCMFYWLFICLVYVVSDRQTVWTNHPKKGNHRSSSLHKTSSALHLFTRYLLL